MAQAARALVVDDDDALRMTTAELLRQDGWQVEEAAVGEGITQRVRERPFSLVILDQKLPDADGVELVEQLREEGYQGTVVVMTGYPTIHKAALALGSAATDYVTKPLDRADLLKISRGARDNGGAEARWEYLWRGIHKRHGFTNVLSVDSATRHCYRTAARVADSNAGVLIEGETGTGKEYLARAIHYMSRRSEKPFIALNCGAIPDTLLESELFGHEKGAFTSATSAKQGLFEMADGGTLLLDEVGELTPAAQVKLLRFLQDGTLYRLGSLTPVTVDVRVIAATNRDLTRLMQEGSFREDLFYRLAVVPLYLPPLRERPGDVPLFARHFLHELARDCPRTPREFDEDALATLRGHHWPGNLRELGNVVQRAALLACGKCIHARHVDFSHIRAPAA